MSIDRFFKCAACEGTFLKGWSDAEATKEYRENYGKDPNLEGDDVIICDSCHLLLEEIHQREAQEAVKH